MKNRRQKMITLLNKLLARFGFQLVSTKPDTRLVDETVKYLNTLGDLRNDGLLPPYVGDINYLEDKNGKTYFRQEVGRDYKYFDYDGDTYTPEQLEEKLND
jgi:hypothetical protein